MCAGRRRGVLLNEFLEPLLCPSSVVLHGILPMLHPVDGGETLHIELAAGHVIGCGVHLGNGDLVIALECGSHLGVDGGQAFAVATPWGVELNHDILAAEHNLVELLGNDNLMVGGRGGYGDEEEKGGGGGGGLWLERGTQTRSGTGERGEMQDISRAYFPFG